MVSKLSFKGDKPKKKKVIKRVPKSFSSKPEIDPELLETSWTTATTFADLNGPVIIATYERSHDCDHLTQQPLVLTPDILGNVMVKKEVRIVEPFQTVNFESDDINPLVYHAPIHRTEPGDVQQVFIAISVSFMTPGTTVNPNRTRIALKTPSDKYFSITGAGEIDCKNEAIGPYQIFEFERLPEKNEGVWFRIWNNERRLVLRKVDDKLKFEFKKDLDEGETDLFVIRVQAKNSATGKRLLREHEESKTMGSDSLSGSIRNAIDSLQRSGIEVTQTTMKRLKDAAMKGKLNEQLLMERQKNKSDSRCF